MAEYRIHDQALEHLAYESSRMAIPRAFGSQFTTTRADDEHGQMKSRNWYVLLKPDEYITNLFGINKELLCLVSQVEPFDRRVLDYAEKLFKSYGHRVTEEAFILICSAKNARSFCEEYLNTTGRIVILASMDDIAAANPEFPLTLLRKYLFARDLFDQKSPVANDFQFFARTKIIDELYDDLVHGQNRGIFGLRKTGKTSVLQRLLEKNNRGGQFISVLVDAQNPIIYEGNADTVALELARLFNRALGSFLRDSTGVSISDSTPADRGPKFLEQCVSQILHKGNRALLVMDELERILPSTTRITVWNREYLKLWRLLRSISQTHTGQFVFLLASTNPFFVEESIFDGEDNPLYAFIKGSYLGLFSESDLAHMIRTLGRRMGVMFTESAIAEIYAEYGGHPYLSRQFCSFVASRIETRPIEVDVLLTRSEIAAFFSRVIKDLAAILKVFKEFYPDEHSVMELLATDAEATSLLLIDDPLLATHLEGYGIINRTTSGSARFAIRALAEYFMQPIRGSITPPALELKVQQRHLSIQTYMNALEPMLRSLVLNQFRNEYRDEWREEVLKHCQPHTKELLAGKRGLSAEQFIENLTFTELLELILARFKLFSRLFFSKDEFRRKTEGAKTARAMSDHRRQSDCADDAAYLLAESSVRWMLERLNI